MRDNEAVPVDLPEGEDNFAFVMNVWRLTDNDSYELAPDHLLKRANAGQIALIKQELTRIGPPPVFQWDAGFLWEQAWPRPEGPVQRLPPEEWRYFVITWPGALATNDTILRIQSAASLTPAELEIGFHVFHHGPVGGVRGRGTLHTPDLLYHVLHAAEHNDRFFTEFSAPDLEAIARTAALIERHDDQTLSLRGPIGQIHQLKALPHNSPLRFLGYFAVLESILTHSPDPTDPYDSITRQVKSKIALLDHRWRPAIDYSSFDAARADTVWTKMYKYRSCVAHGGRPDFGRDLAVLRSDQHALALIKETVKAVVRQALAEPQLLADLHDC